ncbi:hypothetical protein BMS3Bbin06_01256 [bacterium BMS3Bbin06]|nr:hypothetical protein BMS3Abin08_00883 [bacterium BMS3Abin08]GBE34726.1 hypothetical protein BMS3Bbin06_01256 [bacterium BMS3Bbin06]
MSRHIRIVLQEQAISRVLYGMVISLWTVVTHSLLQPTRSAQSGGPPSRRNLFGLAPDRVCRACEVTLTAVGSYPTFSPLPRTRPIQVLSFIPIERTLSVDYNGFLPVALFPIIAFQYLYRLSAGRYLFCGTFPGVAPGGC